MIAGIQLVPIRRVGRVIISTTTDRNMSSMWVPSGFSTSRREEAVVLVHHRRRNVEIMSTAAVSQPSRSGELFRIAGCALTGQSFVDGREIWEVIPPLDSAGEPIIVSLLSSAPGVKYSFASLNRSLVS